MNAPNEKSMCLIKNQGAADCKSTYLFIVNSQLNALPMEWLLIQKTDLCLFETALK